MSAGRQFRNWQSVQEEVLRRIYSREWSPGEIIPSEVDLAEEFGCARTTVNRALRSLADSGWLDRRRKAGTRVSLHPARKATLTIPITRQEIEARGERYGYTLLERRQSVAPPEVRARLDLAADKPMLHVEAVHLANGRPHMFEYRWINIEAVPSIVDADLATMSANEWLVVNAPFTCGDIAFGAINASECQAGILGTRPGEALFVIERTTFDNSIPITWVRLTFTPGHRLHTMI
ncbi:MAG: UTRA domain-containing protein [Geminicoccaceae bacterium]